MTAVLRAAWRQLTSMRTALVLLFLLAVAAIPGSLLPQRSLGVEKVDQYIRDHPGSGPWLDRFWLFEVYASPWFSAIYLLLFVSLVGCLVPRLRTHATALLREPPDAPRRLDRLPASAGDLARDCDAATAAQRLRALLRKHRFRVAVRSADDVTTVSAEKGYLKESGNLLFHFALLGMLVGVALGSWNGWHANRLVVAGPDGAFCNSLQQYDDYQLGARVDVVALPKFCVELTDFQASYLDNGQPVRYIAEVRWTEGERAGQKRVEVNDPLRLPGANVYLLGHGYAPMLRYTDRNGRTQTAVAPFLPSDESLTSEGVAAFPDANLGSATPAQVAFAGVYLPTLPADPSVGRSAFPGERDPALMLAAYVGNLGLDAGTVQSVYSLNRRQVDNGQLKQLGEQKMLRVGETWRLPDGTSVEFLGTRQWISVSVRHDPGERVVLFSAILLLLGLLASLAGRRRRIWFRVSSDRIAAGGLPRSDYPGFVGEFEAIVQEARGVLMDEPRTVIAGEAREGSVR
jgi:cytochrome c biogenesis protein